MSDVVIPADESDEDESEKHDGRWAQCPFCSHWMEEGCVGAGTEPCPHFICDTCYNENWDYVINSFANFENDAEALCHAVAALQQEMKQDAATQDQVQRQIAQAPESVSKLLGDMLARESDHLQDFVSLFADYTHEWDNGWGSGCFFFAADAQATGKKIQASVKKTLGWVEKHIETE